MINQEFRAYIDKWIYERFPDEKILLPDGLEAGFVGVATVAGKPLAVLDSEICIQVLMSTGMSEEDAEEYFNFNVSSAFLGDGTPAFLTKFSPEGFLFKKD